MYNQLREILSNDPSSILLYKNNDEYDYLLDWLSREDNVNQNISLPKPATCSKGSSADVAKNTATVFDNVSTCTACPGIIERKKSVGDGSSGVMIILNAPIMMSSFEKNELRGESVEILKKIVASMNLPLPTVYITNMIKCESSDPLLKPSTQLQSCLHFLEDEIEQICPSVVIVMGDLTPLRRTRKKFINSSWFEIPHPLTLIKNPPLKREAWNTLQLIMSVLEELKENKL